MTLGLGCEDCPYKGRKVGSRGNPKSPIVFVGEAPGSEELRAGAPFVGPSGEVLDGTIPEDSNIEPLYTNALQCRPNKNKKKDDKLNKAISCCNNRLMEEIWAHPRKIVVALGNIAMHSLTGNKALKITRKRGHLIPSTIAEHGILPVVHPAAILRGTGNYRQFKRDINYAVDLAEGGKPHNLKDPTYQVFSLPKSPRFKRAVNFLGTQKELAADIETSGLVKQDDRILDLGIYGEFGEAYIFPAHTIKHLKRIFSNKKIKWIWHNGKFDIGFLRDIKVKARVDEDTLLESYVLDETGGVHDLEQVSLDALGAPDYKDILKPYLPKKDSSYELVPKPVLYRYLAFDVRNTWEIHKKYKPQIMADKLSKKLLHETLIPASELLHNIESRGILVDKKHLAHLASDENENSLSRTVRENRERFHKLTKSTINLNSSKQVAEIIYDKLKLGRYTSTDKDTLKKMLPNEIITCLMDYRKAAKALSTYVFGMEKVIRSDGCVHSSFLLHGTPTGRLASRGPNIQNITRNKDIRNMFIARPGYVLIEFDFNQAELRSLACVSGDKFLCDVYNSDHASLHHEVAVDMFGENYDHEQYMRAKAVNFGIVYGREAPSLAEEFKIPIREAQRMIDVWFRKAVGAKKYIDSCRNAAKHGRTLNTTFGRRKRFKLVTRQNLRELQNQASNFPHQSIASDCNLHAAMRIYPQIIKLDAHILNLVHDSTLIECPNNKKTIDFISKVAIKEMEAVAARWGLTRVPFKADIKGPGKRWGNLKEAA